MPDLAQQAFLAWLMGEEESRQQAYAAYREYYDGQHDTQLTERQRAFLQLKMGAEFRTNYCPIVVDSLCERLKVTGFNVENQGQADQLWDWWTLNRMEALQGTMHLATVRDGDAYLMVEWDNQAMLPRFVFEPALCNGVGVQVVYGDERSTPVAASKRWQLVTEAGDGETGKKRRLNVYYPDRIERFISDNQVGEGNWQPYEAEGLPAVEPWVDSAGQPLGIPIVHFKNKPAGYAYGASELRDVIPLQNALNKALIDLVAAADTTAFRIFWMLGDDPSNLTLSPGSWVYSTRPPGGDQGAALGFFPGEDLAPMIAVLDALAIEVARVTRTPVSYFQVSGQRPAEGTLKQEESGLVGKARDRMVTFGNAWEDALGIARRLHNTFGPGGLDETALISTTWDDPETRNDKVLMEELKIKHELGVPQEQLWREMGYDAAEIKQLWQLKEAEDKRQANLGALMLKRFNRGQLQGGEGMEETPEEE